MEGVGLDLAVAWLISREMHEPKQQPVRGQIKFQARSVLKLSFKQNHEEISHLCLLHISLGRDS